jgi:hypothetical protein
LTVSYTPQQNGRAERFNHTLLEKSEAMRQHACLPLFFWQDAIETSLHIYNRQSIHHHNWHTPIQLWNGNTLDISYFKTFGCQAYVYIPKDRRANKLAPKSEDMIFIGYEPGTKGYRFWFKIRRTVKISSTATFDEFDFPNCPREKIPDKLPPVNQSPNPSDDEETDPGGDDGHQPLDIFNQDDHQPGKNSPGNEKPYVKPTEPWSGRQELPSEDSDDSDDLYGQPPKYGPSKPVECTSTEVLRNTSLPAPNRLGVSRPDPVPRPCFLQNPRTEPSMGYGKSHPKAPMEPRIRPPRLIKPVIQKNSVYGNRTPIQMEQEIRSEQDFVRRILRQGFQDQPEPSTTQQRNPDTPLPENPDEEEPNTRAGKIVLSSTSFTERLSYAVETTDVPKFFRDLKKMPKEDQQGWIDACDNEIKSLAE